MLQIPRKAEMVSVARQIRDLRIPMVHPASRRAYNSRMKPRPMAAWLLLTASCGATATQASARNSAQVTSPRAEIERPVANQPRAPLVLALVIDQLGAWVARERLATLPASGGFARLRREGTYFQEMAFAHAITETAPGHASLFTGLVPRQHGIVANEVWGPEGRSQSILLDAKKKRLTVEGPAGKGVGISLPEGFPPVLADYFRARHGQAGFVAALSLKDRGAAFGAGRSPDVALWFDPDLGTFVASEGLGTGVPPSLGPLIEPAAIAALEAEPWQPLDEAWLKRHAQSDAGPGEGDLDGFGTEFPHLASKSRKPGGAFRTEPRSDRLLLQIALKLLDDEARGRPTFLALSLSANDYIGHVFGPDSWEAWDELLRLDAALAWFFGELDRRFGPTSWSIALTGDHGIAPLPEQERPACGKDALAAKKPCGPGHRIFPEKVAEVARAVAKSVLMDDKAVAGVVDPYVYLSPTGRSLDARLRTRFGRALERALARQIPGVEKALDVATFPAVCPESQEVSIEALVCRSIHPGIGGDYFVVLAPGSFFDTGLVKQGGTSHGSPYGYDRFVPLFLREPNRDDSAGKIVEEPCPFTAYHDALVRMIDAAAR